MNLESHGRKIYDYFVKHWTLFLIIIAAPAYVYTFYEIFGENFGIAKETFDIMISAAFIVSTFAAVFSVLFQRLSLQQKEKKEEEVKITQKAVSQAQINLISDILTDNSDETLRRYFNNLLHSQQEYYLLSEDLISLRAVNTTEMAKRVEDELAPLKARLEEIEKRFPKESTIEKIASINDAIMATQIEHLIQEIKMIDKKILTKWDVAKIVLEMIAMVGIVGSIILGVVQYLAAKGTP